MRPNSSSPRVRRGYTLVEMMVVITIIAILAGLTSAAVMSALWNAKQTRIKVELDQLDTAMKAFRERYGAYPPANLRINPSAGASDPVGANLPLRAFIAKAFPRYNQANLFADLQAAGAETTYSNPINPAAALVFWLRGFSPDVTRPFTGAGVRTPLYNFDKSRLVSSSSAYPAGFNDMNGNGVFDPDPVNPSGGDTLVPMVYMAPGSESTPYLYYDYRIYTTTYNAVLGTPGNNANAFRWPPAYDPWQTTFAGAMATFAVPYALDVDKSRTVTNGDSWINPDSFQIIAAGQDGLFGPLTTNALVRLYPTAVQYTEADYDNVTNFCERNNLEDARP